MKKIRETIASLTPARAARWLKPALVLAFALAAGLAGAQPNDFFANAWTLTGPSGSTNDDNTGATLETCETNLVNTDDNGQVYLTNSVWFVWTPTNNGAVRFDTMGSSFDTVLSVWTTGPLGLCDPALTNLVSDDNNGSFNDPFGNNTSLLEFNATANTPYYISVNSFDDGTFTGFGGFGPYVLNWTSAPPNDNFDNAWVLTGYSGTTNGNNIAATLEIPCETNTVNTDNAGPDPVKNSVWFAWTAPTSGILEMDTAGSGFETVLSAWTTTNGLCDTNLADLISDDSFSSLDGVTAQINFPVTAGTTYYISVESFDDGIPGDNVGNYVLNWNETIPTLPSGTFKFTLNNYVVSETDSAGPNSTTVSPSLLGARVTVTRPPPAYGRVTVDYAVTGGFYTNTITTNSYGTNIYYTFTDTNGTVFQTNYYSTNIYILGAFESHGANGYQFAYTTNAFTNSATLVLSGVVATNFLVGSAVLAPVPTNLPFVTNFSTTVTGNGGGFNTSFTTNVFGYLQLQGGRPPHGTNFLDGSTYTNGSSLVFTNYEVFYTNTFITNFFGTNILLTYNSTAFNGPSYTTNFYYTNIVTGYVYSTNSIYTNGLSTVSVFVFGTNWVVDTTNLVMSIINASNRLSNIGPLIPQFPVPTNALPPLGSFLVGQSDTGPTLPELAISTNSYSVRTFGTQLVPSQDGISLVTGTLTFDDYQMSQDILVPVNQATGPDVPSVTGIPSYATITLSNPLLDPLEDTNSIIAPTVDPINGVATISALSSTYPPGPAVLNFERSTFRVDKNVNGGNAVVYLTRNGAGCNAVSVNYRIDYGPGVNQLHTFQRQAGSDYANPDNQPNPDFTSVTGTVSWGQGDFTSKPINVPIPILNNGLVEFNADMQLQLYNPTVTTACSPDPGVTVGEVGTAVLTILFDNTTVLGGAFPGQQPAGAVDRSWNKDNSYDSTPPQLLYPGTTPGEGGTVFAVATQPDGKAIIAGSFVSFDSTPYSRIVRTLGNGYQDSSFLVAPNSGANDYIAALALQPDGKIIIGGNFTAFNGYNRHYIARLNNDGSLDTTFNPGLGANGLVSAVALESSGQIVIAGQFTTYNGNPVNEVARLNTDGSLDTSFNPGIGPNGAVDAVAVDASGRVIIGGNFDMVAGVSSGAVARLNVDGSLDTTFAPGIGTYNPETFVTDAVKAVAVDASGRILIGGSFSYFDLVNYNGLVRLTADGTVDLSFQPGTGTLNPVTGDADTVDCIVLQPDGNILIGGNFTTFNQTRRVGLARILSVDGTLDTSFMDTAYNQFAGIPNRYFNANAVDTNSAYLKYNTRNSVYALAVETDGNIIIGGSFTRVGGGSTRDDIHPRSNVARVIGGSTPGPGNMQLLPPTSAGYSVNNSDGHLYVALTRTNGNLGIVSATFTATNAAPGPGIAGAGDYTLPAAYTNPEWGTDWSTAAWMYDVGKFGPNYNLAPGAADVYITVANPGNISGNLSANFSLSDPVAPFDLAGEYIPLGAALGADISSPLTIIDSNVKSGVLGFSSPTYTVREDGSVATITLIRTNGSDNSVTVFYATSNGTATNGVDYIGTTNSVTFGIGVTTNSFTVPTRALHTSIQPDKTVILRLFTPSGGATLGLTNAVLTLVNPNFTPGVLSFTSPTYSTNETAGAALITVQRLGGSSGQLNVTLIAIAGGINPAVNGTNFIASTNSLQWNDSDVSVKTVAVPVLHDGVSTPDLTVNLMLTNSLVTLTNNPQPLTLNGASNPTNAVLTIVNVDSAGSFQFSAPVYSVQKDGGYALIPVIRTGGSVGTVQVSYTTLDGSAVQVANYVTNSGTLTFTNGQVSEYFTVPVIDDGTTNNPSGPKNLFVQLSNPTGNSTLGSPTNSTLYIIDSDSVNEPPGSPDTTYSSTAGFNNTVYALALQSNNQLLAGGDFTMANGVPRNRIARLNSDGTLDAAFSLPSDAYGASGSVRAIAIQADQRILLGGFFTNFNSVRMNYVTRINPDGTLDSTFNPGAGADNPVNAVAETFVGGVSKVLLGGSFASISGTPFNGVARLNSNGSADTAFNFGGLGANGPVYALAVQPADGKIVIGGAFTAFNGQVENYITRLNADGSVDTNFNAGGIGANATVRAVALQLDGKILLGGDFTNVNNTALSHIARLNADGTVDSAFVPGVGADDSVFSIALQSNNRIVLGGEFQYCSGVTRNRITRLNPDGTVDPTINFGTGANNFVAAVVIQADTIVGYPTNVPDEKIIIGGGFTQYFSQPHKYLARIFGGSMGGSGAFKFSSASYTVDEKGTNAVITILRTGGTTNAPTGDVFITASTLTNGSTAVVGTNYSAVTTNLDFPLGEVLKTFTIPVFDDGVLTPNLTVNLAITNPTAPAQIGNQPTAVLTILNDDTTVSFSSGTYSVPKNIVSGVAAISIVRSGGTSGAASVNFTTTTGGSAAIGTDYTPVTQTVNFAPGVSTVTVNIPINNNGLPEGPRTVVMQLASATGTVLVNPTNATLTIIDTVNAPGQLSFSAPTYVITEGGGVGYTNAYITVNRTNGSYGTVTVAFTTQDGSAVSGVKYVSTNGVLSFAQGETSKTFFVPVINTATAEGPESLSLVLSSPTGGASLTSPSTATLTILNTNIGLAFVSAVNAFTEPSGLVSGTVTLNVIRFNNTNGFTHVYYSTTNGTAVAGTNFVGVTNAVLTFNPGDAVKPIVITTLHDPRVTGDLFFTVGLSNPSGSAQLTPPSFTVVTDHDADAGLSFFTNAVNVARNAGYVLIPVYCSNTNVEPVYVNYSTGGGSGVPGTDYTTTSGTLSFTNGVAFSYFIVPILLNNEVQTNRTFNVTLSSPTVPGVLLQPPAGYSSETVTIIGTNSPPGLSFLNPINLGTNYWGSTNADNTYGAPEVGDPIIAGQTATAPVWFQWTAPANGEVSMDTIGSYGTNGLKLDTVLGVFTGGSLSTLSQVAANDDLYPQLMGSENQQQQNYVAQNIYNPNQVITAFTNYVFDPIQGFIPQVIYRTNNFGQYRSVASYYTQPYGGPSGLRFNAKVGTTYYIAADTKSSGFGYTIVNGVLVATVSGRGPISLNWAYHPAGVLRFATEDIDQTGITSTNGNPMLLYECAEDESFQRPQGNVNPNQYSTTLHSYYAYNAAGLLVTVTRVAGSSGRIAVDYTTVDGNTNQITNGDNPAVAYQDYIPASGTLVFDDYEMSKTILITIQDDGQQPQPNRDFTVVLSNPRRDPSESPLVSAPRVDAVYGQVMCRILDTDTDPKGPSFSQIVSTNLITGLPQTNIFPSLQPTNSIFNFAKKNYRVGRDAQSGYWHGTPVTVFVNRMGTNNSAVTLAWRIDNYFLDRFSAEDVNNDFPLMAASDYATPFTANPPRDNNIYGPTTFDFAGVAGESGTVSFPSGNGAFNAQPIQFTIYNNQIPQFNKDIHIGLYQVDSNGNPLQDGMVAECTLTILFDDLSPPAGSVDEFYNPDFGVDIYAPTNTIGSDVSYPGTEAFSEVYSVAVTPGNQTIIGGAFQTYTDGSNDHTVNGLARLNRDGSLDTTFNTGSGINVFPGGEFIRSVALSGNQVVIGGDFTSYNGVQRNSVARVNSDGSLDTTFTPGGGANGQVWSVLVQSDGRVLIGGEFTGYNGATRNYVARLNTDGSLDTTFNTSNLISGPVYAMALAPDGSNRLLIGGHFSVAGQSYVNLARLNADGSLDTSFSPSSGPDNSVLSVAWQTNNQVLAGGLFQNVSGVPFNYLARLNADGSIDGNFFIGTGADNTVNSITLDPSGLIYIGGPFTEINGTHRLGFARLNMDGTVDTTFLDTAYNQFAGLPRIHFNDPPGTVYSSAIQSDGNVIIGGSFAQVGGGQLDPNVRTNDYIYDPSISQLSQLNANVYLEPKSRDGVRNRGNVARLIGGATPGPGNLGFTANSYAANKTQSIEAVTLIRTNGTMGYASANFSVLPGLAQSGVDYSYNGTAPTYPIGWEYNAGLNQLPTRQHIDGFYSINGLMLDSYGQTYPFGLGGPASVTVSVLNNTAESGNLSAAFQLANPGADQFYLGGQNIPLGVALGASAAPFTVVDNAHQDGVLGFASGSYVSTNALATIGISRTNGTYGTVQVNYQTTAAGTAVPGTDYQPTNGLITFNSGQNAGSFPVNILQNSSISSQEKTVGLQLYNVQDLTGGNASLGQSSALLRIINPNFPGYLSLTTNAYYGNLSAGVITFTVTRTVGAKGTLTLQYATADGTGSNGATNGVHYTGATNTLVWNNGDVSSRVISIPLINPNVVGVNRQFGVSIFNPTFNGTNTLSLLGATTNAVLNIINDNSYGTFQFSASSYLFNENGGYATVTVTRNGSALGLATNSFKTADGTAFAGTNYVATNGTLTFLPGQVVKSFNVKLLDDGKTNPPPANFYFAVLLTNASAGSALGSPSNAAVHLVDAESFIQPPGSADTALNAQAGMNSSVLALALQANNQIVAGGSFTVANGTSKNRLARLDPDGTLDGGFLNGLAGADGVVNSVVCQTDQRLLVGGAFAHIDGIVRQRIARLMTDGTLDTSFNPGSGADNSVFSMAETFINGSRGIYVGGAFSTFSGTNSPGVIRLNNDGSIDRSFAIGQGAIGTVYAVAAYPTNSVYNAGKVLVGGQFTNFSGMVVGNLVRLNKNGSVDTNFTQNISVNNAVRAIAIQLDDSVLIGGDFTNVNSVVANHLARLSSSGTNVTVDAAFASSLAPGVNGTVDAIALQADNRIVVGGQFASANGVTRHNITRLLPTGAVDPTINFGDGANGSVNALLIQPADGMIVLGGNFTQYNDQPHANIARIYGGSMTGSGEFQFTSAGYQIDETGTFATITVERTGGTSGPNADGSGHVYVAFSTTNGSAVAGVNYAYTTNYLDFPLGEVIKTVYVPVMDDHAITTNLTVNLSLSNPSSGTGLGDQAKAVLTIINDDSVIEFQSGTYSVPKNTVSGTATIDIIRLGSTSGSCTVNFATDTNGTAAIGTDYIPTNAVITFNPGDSDKQIQIGITNNLLPEGVRTVRMSLTNALNSAMNVALASPSNAVLNIVDTVPSAGQLLFTATNFNANASDGLAYVTVLRTNGTSGFVSANYNLVPGTALPGLNYQPPVTNQSVSFLDGQTTATIPITLINNTVAQSAVSLTVSLYIPNGATNGVTLISPTNTTLTIYNTNAVFNFTLGTNSQPENAGPVSVVVQRFNNTNIVSTVNYATTNGTALAGVNYSNTAGTLSFGLGETFKSISIPLINRTNVTDLAFNVALSSPTNAQLIAPSNTLVVVQASAAGISFTNATMSVLKNAGNAVVTVVCSNPRIEQGLTATNPLTVTYTTMDGTARAGFDYGAVSGTLVFTNGAGTNTFNVPIVNNTSVTGGKSFSVALTNVTAPGILEAPSTQTVVIAESNIGIFFSQNNYSAFKNAGNAVISVYRTGFTDSVASVNYMVTNGTAMAGVNFYPTNGTLVFTNGVTSQSFNVPLVANTTVYPNLFALLSLSSPTNSQVVDPGVATLTILENGGSYVIPAGAQMIANSSATDLANGVIGSNDTVQVLFAFRDSAGLNVTNLIAYLQATNGVASPTASRTYGPLTVYGHSVSQPFTFKAVGTNGNNISPTFQLYDNAKFIGSGAFVFTLGTWTTTFANTNTIIINDNAAATPYPSLINVTGVGSSLIKATVTLTNLSHASPSDLDVLVVSPTTNTLVMAHAGGGNKINHVTLTFDDAATNYLPQNAQIYSGTNKPTDYFPVRNFP